MLDWITTLTNRINEGMQTLGATSDTVFELTIALAAVGVVAMAVTDLVKNTFRVRKLFNLLSIRMWIHGSTLPPSGAGSFYGWPAAFCLRCADTLVRFRNACGKDATCKRDCVWTQLSTLATSGDVEALYALKPAALMGQVAAASRVAVASPVKYRELLGTLVGRGGKEELDALSAASETLDEAKKTVEQAATGYREALAALERETTGEANERETAADIARRRLDESRATEAARQADVDAARTRVTYFIERHIDAFQINLAARWERWNRVAAFVIAFALVLGFLSANVGVLSAVPIALLAAFIAPVAKDLVASLKKVRGRS